MASTANHWMAQVRLLDDAPVTQADGDLLQFGGKVDLVAQSLLNASGPMVVLVEGGWGRGKTSFCNLLEHALGQAGQATVRWYIASDDDGPARDVLLRVVADGVTEGDPAEVQRVVARWGHGDGPAFDRFDAFRRWVGRTLGQTPQQTEGTKTATIPLSDGDWRIEAIQPERRLVTVFVDDLDRCRPERVKAVLDALRTYVACPGLAFVIAADHQVIQRALAQTVAELGIADLRRPTDALEKYVRHRVRLSDLRGLDQSLRTEKMQGLERRLFAHGDRRLMVAPGSLKDGVATLIADHLLGALTVRRLKRLLNAIAEDLATLADQIGIGPELPTEADWQAAYTRLHFGGPPPSQAQRLGWYAGRTIERLIHHTLAAIWPEALADVVSDETARQARYDALTAIGQAEDRWPDTGLRLALDALVPNTVPVPLTHRRAVCKLLASLRSLEGVGQAPEPTEAEPRTADPLPQPELVTRSVSEAVANLIPAEPTTHAVVQPAAATKSGPLAGEALEREARSLGKAFYKLAHSPMPPKLAVDRHLQMALALVGEARGDLERLEGLFAGIDELFIEHEHVARPFPRLVIGLANAALAAELHPVASTLFHAVFAAWQDIKLTSLWLEVGSQHLNYVLNSNDHRDIPANEIAAQAARLLEVADIEHWTGPGGTVTLSTAAKVERRLADSGDHSELAKVVTIHLDSALQEFEIRFDETREVHAGVELLRLLHARDRTPSPELLSWAREMSYDRSPETEALRRLLGDVMLRLDDPEFARQCYLSLEGTRWWTPSVLHNLATLIRAEEGPVPEVGRYWSAAYRAGARDGRLLRGFANYLSTIHQGTLVLIVLRGQPLPEDWHPFGEPIDPDSIHAEWEASHDP